MNNSLPLKDWVTGKLKEVARRASRPKRNPMFTQNPPTKEPPPSNEFPPAARRGGLEML